MTVHVKGSAEWGHGVGGHGLCRGRQSVELPPHCPVLTVLVIPHQIGQAIEEVNSNNQELLRKYRRELQLRKKCHNELVRLKGGCWVGWRG